MKKCIVLLLILLLLTGCSRETVPPDRPHSLEVEYGDSGVFAQTSFYEWYWKDHDDTPLTLEAPDPLTGMDKLPYLNAGRDTQLKLNFAVEPDKLLVERRSDADGYLTSSVETVSDCTLTAPLDDQDHLYTVTAVWLQEKGVESWGSCTYDFRFLAHGVVISNTPSMPEYSSLDVYQVAQLDASALMGVEVVNNVDGLTKTCRTQSDKQAILDFLKNNLSTEFVPISVAAPEADYMLRLVCVDGTQLTIGYGSDGAQSWLLVGGAPYEAGQMDMAAMWNALEAGTLSQEAVSSGKNYLAMSDVFPGEHWGTEFVYGYLTKLDSEVVYNEMRWLEDNASPNGFRLENGWTDQSKPVADSCEYWILEDHHEPYCQVSAQDLMSLSTDVLFRIYTKDGQVVALCEQFLP